MTNYESEASKPKPAFGAWPIQQKGRDDSIGELAKLAATDRSFPRGEAKDVRHYLNKQQADPMLYEVVDDAETDWLSQ